MPYLKKNIDDLYPEDPDLNDILDRLIHFPSENFVIPSRRIQEQEKILKEKWNVPSANDMVVSNITG